MDWFLTLLAITTAIRGIGAGIIYDVALVSLPLRKRIGIVPYAQYARANYRSGVKTYLLVSVFGALFTIAVTAGLFTGEFSPIVFWSIIISFIATIMAFFGTSRALPAVLRLRKTTDDENVLSKVLDRFAFWHTFSTVWQVTAFIALVFALASYS